MQAQKIAELLNKDFNSVRDRLTNIRAVAAKSGATVEDLTVAIRRATIQIPG
jgi:hypothetical protein